MRNPYRNYLQKRRIPLNTTINDNKDNTHNILNTAKRNKILCLGGIVTFKSNVKYLTFITGKIGGYKE